MWIDSSHEYGGSIEWIPQSFHGYDENGHLRWRDEPNWPDHENPLYSGFSGNYRNYDNFWEWYLWRDDNPNNDIELSEWFGGGHQEDTDDDGEPDEYIHTDDHNTDTANPYWGEEENEAYNWNMSDHPILVFSILAGIYLLGVI